VSGNGPFGLLTTSFGVRTGRGGAEGALGEPGKIKGSEKSPAFMSKKKA